MNGDPEPALDSLSAGMRISASNLTITVSQLLAATGMDDQSAVHAAELLVWAQSSGINSHGVMHLPSYVRRLLDGTINVCPRLAFENPDGASSALDADNALGCLAAFAAIQEAMRRAGEHGLGAIAVRNSSHFGPAGVYVHHAAIAGYVAMAFSNASPTMAPWGGREPVLGTNPIAAAFPRSGPPADCDRPRLNDWVAGDDQTGSGERRADSSGHGPGQKWTSYGRCLRGPGWHDATNGGCKRLCAVADGGAVMLSALWRGAGFRSAGASRSGTRVLPCQSFFPCLQSRRFHRRRWSTPRHRKRRAGTRALPRLRPAPTSTTSRKPGRPEPSPTTTRTALS